MMIEIIMKFLLLFIWGAAGLLAAMVAADYGDELLARLIRRWQQAKLRVGWQDVAARHRRRVKV